MKRIALALALASVLIGSVQPAMAGDWGYPAAPYGYPPQQDHPVLRKVLVGAGLIGIGLLIGRATAPQPQYGYSHYQPQFQPQFGAPIQHYPHQRCAPRPGHFRF